MAKKKSNKREQMKKFSRRWHPSSWVDGKHPGGRPSEYNSKFCQMLIEHMARGLSFEAFGALVGQSATTLYNWVQKYPEFLEAKKVGKTLEKYFWEEMGVEGTTGRIPWFSSQAWKFNMENRAGWREKKDAKVASTGTVKLTYNLDD